MALYKLVFDHIMVPQCPGYGIVAPDDIEAEDREYLYYVRLSKNDYSKDDKFATVELPDNVANGLLNLNAIEEVEDPEDVQADHVGIIDRTVAGAEGPNALTNVEQAASLDMLGRSAKPHVKNAHFTVESSPEEFTEQVKAGDVSPHGDTDPEDSVELPEHEKQVAPEPQKRGSGQSGANVPKAASKSNDKKSNKGARNQSSSANKKENK